MFTCDECGKCCSNLPAIEATKNLRLDNGCCKFLKNNLCEIYENRPIFCRGEKMFELVYSKIMTKKEFDKKRTEICDRLKRSSIYAQNSNG